VVGRRGVERLWSTHPLRYEPLPTGFRHDPVVSRALLLLLRKHDHPLAMQRVIWIRDKNLLGVMMGSMQCRRSVVPKRC
jgi:hypothetical protein